MSKNILVINGHPDPDQARVDAALAAAYVTGANSAGHHVESLNVAQLDFPMLRRREDWEKATPCADIAAAQLSIQRADHIVLIYPLWLSGMPALLKGFLEQVLRPGFAFSTIGGNRLPEKKLRGKSARIVITMGMPGLAFRWFYVAHSLRSLKRNILAFCGIGPVRSTLIGMVESHDQDVRRKALRKLEQLGRDAR